MVPDIGPKSLKRPKEDNCWGNPNEKRRRMCSPRQMIIYSPTAKSKIWREIQQDGDVEMTTATMVERLTARAGRQPCRQP